MKKAAHAKALLRLGPKDVLPEFCAKCGSGDHIGWRNEVLMFAPRDALLFAALFGAIGGALRPHRFVRLRLPICGDCEARWEHAKDGERFWTFAPIVALFVLGGAAYLFESKIAGFLALLSLFGGYVYRWVFQRQHVRPHVVWIEALSDDDVVHLGGIHRDIHRRLEPDRPRSYRKAT